MEKQPVKGYVTVKEKLAIKEYCKRMGNISEASVVRLALRELLKEELKED